MVNIGLAPQHSTKHAATIILDPSMFIGTHCSCTVAAIFNIHSVIEEMLYEVGNLAIVSWARRLLKSWGANSFSKVTV